jgi:hypothetical protein
MAITHLEFTVLTSLRAHGIITPGLNLLELGQSNWYGDVSVDEFEAEIRRLVGEADRRDLYLKKLAEAVAAQRATQLHEIAEIFWQAVLSPREYSAIDPGETGSRWKFDLNLPVPIEQRFDLTMNIGTAEHIFNVWQFFKTAHERTASGGLMMHSNPFTGWPDHGFFNFQPTLFFDLALANNYEILSFVIGRIKPFEYVQVRDREHVPQLIRAGKIPAGSHINVVYRKTGDGEFVVPMQGYYAGVLGKEGMRGWRELR